MQGPVLFKGRFGAADLVEVGQVLGPRGAHPAWHERHDLVLQGHNEFNEIRPRIRNGLGQNLIDIGLFGDAGIGKAEAHVNLAVIHAVKIGRPGFVDIIRQDRRSAGPADLWQGSGQEPGVFG